MEIVNECGRVHSHVKGGVAIAERWALLEEGVDQAVEGGDLVWLLFNAGCNHQQVQAGVDVGLVRIDMF